MMVLQVLPQVRYAFPAALLLMLLIFVSMHDGDTDLRAADSRGNETMLLAANSSGDVVHHSLQGEQKLAFRRHVFSCCVWQCCALAHPAIGAHPKAKHATDLHLRLLL